MTEDYSVYNYDELLISLDGIKEFNPDVENFLKNFSFSKITNQQAEKNNSTHVFNKLIKEDSIKSKIICCLNKLSQNNLLKIVSLIREIKFQTTDELNELVNQCILKIKKVNDIVRPVVSALCSEFLSLYFLTIDNEKIYFRKLLLTQVKKEYLLATSYESDDWVRDKTDKIMILIATLYNGKIIDDIIMSSIINDFKKSIIFVKDENQEYYEKVEKSILSLSCLISNINLNEDAKTMLNKLDQFLLEQIAIYEIEKCISFTNRLICKNIVIILTK